MFQVDTELKALKAVYDKDVKFREFVLDPTYKRSLKKTAIAQVLKKLGQSNTSVNFFCKLLNLMSNLGYCSYSSPPIV